MASRRARWLIPIVVILVALGADQVTKAWARSALTAGAPVPVIDGYWDWDLSYNPGSAFSLFGDHGIASVALTLFRVAATIGICYVLIRSRPEQRLQRVGLALAFAGAIGNLIDRFGRGVVTDFVHWHWHQHNWPIFNVADAALLIGVGLLLIDSFRRREAPRPASAAPAPASGTGAGTGTG